MSPANGGCIPMMVRRKVDFPIPLGPNKHVSSPSLNSALRLVATVFLP